MSKETRPTVNIYGVLDGELERMHSLLRLYMTLPEQSDKHNYNSPPMPNKRRDIPEIYKRITQMQDVMLACITKNDELIQEKVAELALTGESDLI